MGIVEDIAAASKRALPRIVLAEGEDGRVVQAALQAACEGVARVSVVARPDVFHGLAKGALGSDLVTVHDPATSDHLDAFAEAYFKLREHKGVAPEQARDAMLGNLGFAAMMVRQDHADGTIGGAVATTADTVRAALQIIGKAKNAKSVSSFFLMLLPGPYDRPVVFADCALVITPTAEELAGIAISSAASFQAMTGETPRVAMLSFSTKGSARHESIDRVQEAVRIAKAAAPDLTLDGEIQFDAAFVPEIGKTKAPGSALEGAANVFVFPSLDSANIGYKIAQRIGGAMALGPVLQGLARPANDLSRGCSVDDIRQLIAITGAQAAAQLAAERNAGDGIS
ncbi:MAG: phosphate acetyltransferase [Geminicoccaceae bacterium]